MKAIFYILLICNNFFNVQVSGISIQESLPNVLQENLANPQVPHSFENIQSNLSLHKIKVAIIDTGVDYLHPVLFPHIEFEWDSHQNLIGTGYDFVGNDHWPSPYYARSAYLDDQIALEERKTSRKNLLKSRALVQKEAKLGYWINPQRDIEQELKEFMYHGSFVAGLVTQKNKAIGILPYRVNLNYQKINQLSTFYDQLYQEFDSILKQASSKQVKIVNISIGGFFNRHSSLDKKNWFYISFVNQIKDLFEQYPEIIFVVSSGNAGVWTDGKNKVSQFCDLPLSHVICVGGLNQNLNDISFFSNISLTKKEMIFAPSENIKSTMPLFFCEELSKYVSEKSLNEIQNEEDSVFNSFLNHCTSSNGFSEKQGTSFASAIISHALAEFYLLHPDYSTSQIVSLFFAEHLQKDQIGFFPFYKYSNYQSKWFFLLNE